MNNFHRDGDTFEKIGLGKINTIKKWADKFLFPFKSENIIRDENDPKGHTFEIPLDIETMLHHYQKPEDVPDFLKEGSIKLVIKLKSEEI